MRCTGDQQVLMSKFMHAYFGQLNARCA